MANPSNDRRYALLVARWNDLMTIRRIFIDNNQFPASIDAALPKSLIQKLMTRSENV